MTRDERIRRGESAQQLLNNPIALAALDDVQADCFKAWADSNPSDLEAREFAYKLYLSVKLLRGKLGSWAGDARVEIINSDARKREAAALN